MNNINTITKNIPISTISIKNEENTERYKISQIIKNEKIKRNQGSLEKGTINYNFIKDKEITGRDVIDYLKDESKIK
jgi:hypothetical protein